MKEGILKNTDQKMEKANFGFLCHPYVGDGEVSCQKHDIENSEQ